jgi:hypothetical protein
MSCELWNSIVESVIYVQNAFRYRVDNLASVSCSSTTFSAKSKDSESVLPTNARVGVQLTSVCEYETTSWVTWVSDDAWTRLYDYVRV